MLGQKLVKHCLHHRMTFLATSKGTNRNPDCPMENYASMDIVNPLEVKNTFHAFYPTHVIHTAAITNVDYCELHSEECQKTNVEGTQILFERAKEFQAHFQLLSTDFVFDGTTGMYKETDAVHPLSIYAKSKVDAEQLLQSDLYPNWSIVRTIIVYGKGNNLSKSNLVLWALDALPKGEPMRIIDDQFRMPTWADDLAWGCLEICRRNEKGIFHLSGPELMSIYEVVETVAQFLNCPMNAVEKVSSNTLNQPAKRPPRTGFDLTKSQKVLGYCPKGLREALLLLTKR